MNYYGFLFVNFHFSCHYSIKFILFENYNHPKETFSVKEAQAIKLEIFILLFSFFLLLFFLLIIFSVIFHFPLHYFALFLKYLRCLKVYCVIFLFNPTRRRVRFQFNHNILPKQAH